ENVHFLRVPLRLRPPRLRGTLPPARRASLRPIAIACLRLVTFLPERPDRSVPRLRSCIARSTFWLAFFPYFAISIILLRTFRAELPKGAQCKASAPVSSPHGACSSIITMTSAHVPTSRDAVVSQRDYTQWRASVELSAHSVRRIQRRSVSG